MSRDQNLEICVRDGNTIECYSFNVHWDKPSFIDEEELDPQDEAELRERDEATDFISDFHDFPENLEAALTDFLTGGRVELDGKKSLMLTNVLGIENFDLGLDMLLKLYTKEEVEETLESFRKQAQLLTKCADTVQCKLDQM